ncbi:hypothetical protein [Brasilonema bromeliae]|uniref:Uncharacterized protein n=1 Tax=Brasilonema bromeliae SPC951 TaxID=385972 RepID=A0ABX1PB60_9CYAN|nr:hypothetical protein [Brasilonema bromeliae]NMG21699.1 hypothetical protein [Brasilonema bromeliae SPC951]
MTRIRKQALFAALLFGNVSLSSVSSLVLDKYLKNSLKASYGYSTTLLNSKTKPIHSSSFQPAIGIKFPRFKLPPIKLPPIKLPWGRLLKPLKQFIRQIFRPKKPPGVRPSKPPKPAPVIPLQYSPSNDQQVNLVSDAMSKSKQKQTVQIFLNDMSPKNANLLEQRLEADLTRKIQAKLLTPNLSSQFPVQIRSQSQVQNLSDQTFQEAAESFYPARDAAEQVLASRYKARNGVWTNKDTKDAQLAAQQVIQEQRRQKKELVLSGTLVLSITTTTAIAVIAVESAKAKVQKNNNNRNFRTLPRNRNPVYRLFKKILR